MTAASNSLQRWPRVPLPLHSRLRGFTLIELMVALAIGVVLMLAAAPSMIEYRRNSELSDAVSSFILASNTARAAALKTGINAVVMAKTNNDWSSGWFIFLDKNFDTVFDAGEEVLLERPPLSGEIVSSALNNTYFSGGYILFNGSGFPKTALGGMAIGRLSMNVSDRTTDIVLSSAGRLRTCRRVTRLVPC